MHSGLDDCKLLTDWNAYTEAILRYDTCLIMTRVWALLLGFDVSSF